MNDINIQVRHSEMVHHLAKDGSQILAELTPEKCHLWHMATGVAGESGELIDAVKKHVAYNKAIDRENVIEELGDLEFYLEGVRQAMSISREETLEHNHHKLMTKRYPNGFSNEAAIARADKA
jgi:NTP pyrophosphatase (non-canonical NTP hydrolase)